MQNINPDFNIPYYVFEEIVNYIESSTKEQLYNWQQVERILKLAVANKRLTKQQCDFLINKYSREKNSHFI